MKRVVILLTLLLLCMQGVLAATVSVSPVNDSSNKIYFDEVAIYELRIYNDAQTDKVFSWSVNPLEWVIVGKTAGKVAAGTEGVFELMIQPRPSAFRGPGFYVLPVTVQSPDETIEEQLTVSIRSIEDRLLDYNPSVALGASLSSEVDPRERLSTQIQIRNRNLRHIDNMTLILSSENFYEEDTLVLEGLEERTLEYRFDLDPQVEPGTYNFEVRLQYQGSTISQVQRYYDVVAYSTINRETAVDKQIFKTTQVTMLTNDGNIEKTVSTNLNIPLLKRLFTTIEIDANNIETQSKQVWIITLAPNETATVYVTQNYIALPILLALAIIAIILYFMLRSPIVMKKQIIVTGKDAEGISEMKVRIYVRNRTEQAFYNLRLLDKAPTIADVTESNGLGVLEPTSIIRTEKKGTIIKWDFDSLEAYEERIFSYTIKSKLKIIGNLNLPSVKLRYETSKGKEKTAESGIAQIGRTR